MFALRKKKESSDATASKSSGKDRVARSIASVLIRYQYKSARALTRIESSCSPGLKKMVLILIGLCWAGYCTYILFSGFIGSGKEKIDTNLFSRDSIMVPPHIPAVTGKQMPRISHDTLTVKTQ